MRKTARLKLEYINLLEDNKSLGEMMNWCDSVMGTQTVVIEGLDRFIVIQDEQNSNLKSQIVQHVAKYALADDEIRRQMMLKWIFVGTTILMAWFLTLSLL